MIYLLDVLLGDLSCWFMFLLLNLLNILFYLVLVNAVIIFAICVTDRSSVLFVSLYNLHPVVVSSSGAEFMRVWQSFIMLVCSVHLGFVDIIMFYSV